MILTLIVLAIFIPAPLQSPADIGHVPNPSKSAWFLLWMQELVSYSSSFVYLILFLGGLFFFLPFLPFQFEPKHAQWFAKNPLIINILTLIVFSGIVFLTIVALFFRGENWSLVF
ncbi:MAG: selenite/tellurite reduction operon b-type cytochrome membrane protein ExtQ [Desulfuromusa sp.]